MSQAAKGLNRQAPMTTGKLLISPRGEVCERLKQSVLKTDVPERVPGVRIPPSLPFILLNSHSLHVPTEWQGQVSDFHLEHGWSTLRPPTTAPTVKKPCRTL